MAFQSLYRRYRPQRFGEIVGQEHVVAALRNAAAEDRLGHAYLFSGPRGTGKTSTARILAKVLNCEAPVGGEPCGTCPPCVAVQAGTSFDVTELDAASNRGIQEMKDLLATTRLSSGGRTRLYILDEVHMLTKEASAALLKTLEEPPEHVVFILATTDPEKVLPTIRSRTQHLDFRLLPAAALEAHVRWVIDDAGLEVSEEGIAQALREGGGSARDTLSVLDRIVAAGGVARADESVDDLLDALCEGDPGRALIALSDASTQGRDPRGVGEQVLERLRNAFLAAMRVDLDHLTEADRAVAAEHAERMRPAAITRALEVLGSALVDMRQAPDPRIPLEVALVRITRPDSDVTVDALLARVERLEEAVRSGATGELPSASPAPGGRSPAAEARNRLAAAREADGAEPSGAPEDDPATASAPTRPAPPADEPAVPPPTDPPADGPAPDAAGPSDEAAAPPPTDPPADRPAPSPLAPPAATEAPVEAPEPSASGATSAPVESAAMPTRDELTLAWGDRVLGELRPKAKMLFAGGRFVDHEGERVAFALPNAPHVERCEPLRPDVEAALSAEFGRPIALVLVVDGGPAPAAPAVETPTATEGAAPTAGGPREAPEADELADIGPVDELEDAGNASTQLDRVTDVFGAVQVIEEAADE